MAANGVAAVKLGYDGFAKILGYFGEQGKAKKLKHQIDVAWRELLKGDAADEAVIEAALAAARKASDTSVDHARLAELFTVKKTKGKTSGVVKKKAAGKPKAKKLPKKKAAKRKTTKR